MMTKVKVQGLVSDLMPNIKLMRWFGHFLFNYTSGNILNTKQHLIILKTTKVLMGINIIFIYFL